MRFRTRFLDATGAPGQMTAPAAPAPPAVPPARQPSVQSFMDNLLARYGTAEVALRMLSEERMALETRASAAEAEAQRLRGQLPEGHVVLPKSDAEALAAFRELNLTPEQAREALTDRTRLQGLVADTDRATVATQAATALGWANGKLLAAELKRNELAVELRTVTVQEGGQTVTRHVPYVRPAKDDKATWEPLATYAPLAPYHPAFKTPDPTAPAPAPGVAAAPGAPAAPAAPVPGAVWPAQGPVTGQPPSDPVARFAQQAQAQRDRRPSPLASRPGAAPMTPAATPAHGAPSAT